MGVVHTDIISHITPNDSAGKQRLSDHLPHLQATMDKTTVTTDTGWVLFTQTLSRKSPPGSDGNTTIWTTYPYPSDDGKDKTTVTHSNKDGVC
ncbi:hypothetical protein J7294_03214 [Nakaseomyces glabratus]|nr:hypothetical protein J7294_03214 [Nakaseomyces glabratus]